MPLVIIQTLVLLTLYWFSRHTRCWAWSQKQTVDSFEGFNQTQ